jgi:3-ketosteroid 9alpha-monooxygenase subunit A
MAVSSPNASNYSRRALPIARGWYLALYSDELPIGGVQSLQCVGRIWVLFRGEDGIAAMADAFCPHLGAHLGVGGRMVGTALRCPFHGWEWEREGKCRHIPYSQRIPPGARLDTLPLVERNGALWFWFDPERASPSFDVPAIAEWGDPEYGTQWIRHTYTIRAHPQDILENGIDGPHTMPVHGFSPPTGLVCRFDGPLFQWGFDTSNEVALLDGRSQNFSFRVDTWGLGLSQVRYHGLFSTVFQIGQTPVDEWMTRLTFSVLTRERDRSDPKTAADLRSFTADQVRVLEQDFPIWENKIYRERPLLCEADGPILQFRRWAAQFYRASELPLS